MVAAAIPDNEVERLSELYDYDILDSLPEKVFDDITKIASQICNTPISLISIIDEKRQWFKSKQGLGVPETTRDKAFCAHAILKPRELFEVSDSTKDIRFHDNPLVTGPFNLIYYAGIPLVSEGGYPLGTLCVLDNKPKHLTDDQRETLVALANQVVCLLELRKKNKDIEQSRADLAEVNEELERFAQTVAHDLKSPCNNLITISGMVSEEYTDKLDDDGKELLKHLLTSSTSLKEMVDGILEHTRTVHLLGKEKVHFTFSSLMKEIKDLLEIPPDFQLQFMPCDSDIYSSHTALMQIMINLCTNAIKYNDKDKGLINVTFKEEGEYYAFAVGDNGMGIPEKVQKTIFELFQTAHQYDRFNNRGHGIGLNTVKKLIEKLGGTINVTSETDKGSTFHFTIHK
ncbi:MAG: GAF domain-containing sensor histidine kinase [Taibaiella sp.]|nr:GAF domain-containing sensor histidine kinase [Taibaiella sp.]